MLRAIIFYPLVAIAAAGIILASLNYAAFPIRPAAQAGRVADAAIVFDAEALAHLDPGREQVRYVVRQPLGGVVGVQLSTLLGHGAATPDRAGARLLLTPETSARFAGKALRIDVRMRPLPYVTAQTVAVAAQDESGAVRWLAQPFPSTVLTDAGAASNSIWLRFDAPATAGAPRAIGFWPAAEDQKSNYGVELLEVRIRPADQPRT